MTRSDSTSVRWEANAKRPIIRLTLRQRWIQDRVREAWSEVELLAQNHPDTVDLIICCENPNWLPPNFIQIIVELTTEPHPHIRHIVFVGNPLFEAAFWTVVKLLGDLPAHITYADTVEDALDVLRIQSDGHSSPLSDNSPGDRWQIC